MNILIADDDEVARLMLCSVLTNLGHKVRETRNGHEAWDAWLAGDFHMVITNWVMPDMDGLDFCRRVRAEPRQEFTYIILLTSRSGKTSYLEAMTAGADDFVTKPFEKEEFSARIHAAERIVDLHATVRAANTDLERRVIKRTAELQTALRVKEEFLARASHELRTPMHQILGFAQVLELKPPEAEHTQRVRQILTSGADMMTLIDRILAVSDLPPRT